MNKKNKTAIQEGPTVEHLGKGPEGPTGENLGAEQQGHTKTPNTYRIRGRQKPSGSVIKIVGGKVVSIESPAPLVSSVPPSGRPDMRTPEQRIKEFMEWAESHPRDIPLLSEEAISRNSIY